MQSMAGFTAGAGGGALTAGTVLLVGGALALYQMTSLVLGPSGSRQLHLSLTVPASVRDEPNDTPGVSAERVLGTLAVVPASPARGARHAPVGRPAGRTTVHRTIALVIVPVTPVDLTVPATHPSAKPKHHDD
jgi:hypothetical protein